LEQVEQFLGPGAVFGLWSSFFVVEQIFRCGAVFRAFSAISSLPVVAEKVGLLVWRCCVNWNLLNFRIYRMHICIFIDL
jgi:hypothetical protein